MTTLISDIADMVGVNIVLMEFLSRGYTCVGYKKVGDVYEVIGLDDEAYLHLAECIVEWYEPC